MLRRQAMIAVIVALVITPGACVAAASGAVGALPAMGFLDAALGVGPAPLQFPLPVPLGTATADSFVPPLTIDRVLTDEFVYTYIPQDVIAIGGHARSYYMSDGSSWTSSGYTYYSTGLTSLNHVEVSGDSIQYFLAESVYVFNESDYDAGAHSMAGALRSTGPLVLFAYNGSTNAMLYGQAELISNNRLWAGYSGGSTPFSFFSCIVGSTVPFILSYRNMSGTWTPTTFDQSFQYTFSGVFDFAHPVAVPQLVGLAIRGSNTVPAPSTVQYHAVAQYANGVENDVTAAAAWSLDPSDAATQHLGKVTMGPLPSSPAILTLHAAYDERGVALATTKSITAVMGLSAAPPGSWPMYQGDARHTGYVPAMLDPSMFRLRWARALGSALAVNPVTAVEDRVFATQVTYYEPSTSLIVLDRWNGQTLWSKDFAGIRSLNPPSFAYGNVYVQVSNGANGSALRAFDAATGEVTFIAPHGAQGERYLAPTVAGRLVSVNAGVYGGMYGYDTLNGELLWLQVGLPQVDEWTPAIDGPYSYAYAGRGSGGLYAVDRSSGSLAYFTQDPSFRGFGASMNTSPVIGDQGELLVINNSRLVAYDLQTHAMRWQVPRSFAGQPSVAHGVIFAIDAGTLVAIDEVTHADLWSWPAPSGPLTGTMVVTDSHVFASTATTTYAIDLQSHAQVWSYPAAGALALSEGSLYIAQQSGTLTSIALAVEPTDATTRGMRGQTRLIAAAPNPMRGETRVRFAVIGTEHVRLDVYDLMGRKVAGLVDATMPEGEYERSWIPGANAPAGVYVLQFATGRRATTTKLAVVR